MPRGLKAWERLCHFASLEAASIILKFGKLNPLHVDMSHRAIPPILCVRQTKIVL
jgi:hypothetical protein